MTASRLRRWFGGLAPPVAAGAVSDISMGENQVSNPSETVAGRARQVAGRLVSLINEVRATFVDADPARRTDSMRRTATDIAFALLPVFSWLERQRPPDKARLLNRKVDRILSNAIRCVVLDIPEYAGGAVVHQSTGPSPGLLGCVTLLVVPCNLVAASLVDWANEIEADERAGPPAPDPPAIWSHGEGAYSRDKANTYVVTPEKDNLLQAFLEVGMAMDTKTLKDKSGVSNVSRAVIDFLIHEFGGAVAFVERG